MHYSHERIQLTQLKTESLQELFSLKGQLEGMLDYLYENHRYNIHLNRLNETRVKIKPFHFEDSYDSLENFRLMINSLSCELHLVAILFYPDVGVFCNEVIEMTVCILKKLDAVRDLYFGVEMCNYIISKIPI